MQKFNPADWRKVDVGEKIESPMQLLIQASEAVTVFVETTDDEGVVSRAIAGRGSLVAASLPKGSSFEVIASKSAIVYYKHGLKDVEAEPRPESFTNFDKRPVISGSLAAITVASRQLKRDAAQAVKQIRNASLAAQKVREPEKVTEKPEPPKKEVKEPETAPKEPEKIADEEKAE